MDLKFKILLGIFFLATLSRSVAGHSCPAPNPMPGFDAKKFEGRWFEIKRYSTMFNRFGGFCNSLNFTVISSDNVTIKITKDNVVVEQKSNAKMKVPGVFTWSFDVEDSNYLKQYYL
jgi:lipocalin